LTGNLQKSNFELWAYIFAQRWVSLLLKNSESRNAKKYSLLKTINWQGKSIFLSQNKILVIFANSLSREELTCLR